MFYARPATAAHAQEMIDYVRTTAVGFAVQRNGTLLDAVPEAMVQATTLVDTIANG